MQVNLVGPAGNANHYSRVHVSPLSSVCMCIPDFKYEFTNRGGQRLIGHLGDCFGGC